MSLHLPRLESSRFDLTAGQRAEGTPLMRVTQAMARGLLAALARVEVVGVDNLPRAGGVLLASNHTDVVDGPSLYGLVRRPAVFFVKSEAFVGPVGPFLRRIGQIPVHRGVPERGPLASALETLDAGGLVGIFPEGTRGRGDVQRVEHGIAYLAVRSGAPVVPVACTGTHAMLRTLRRAPVRVIIGEPVQIAAGPATRRAVDEASEQIRLALADLARAVSDAHREAG